jgi:hypothetical protein
MLVWEQMTPHVAVFARSKFLSAAPAFVVDADARVADRGRFVKAREA